MPEAIEDVKKMTLEAARELALKIADEVLEDVKIAFTEDALEAAAMLRDQDKPAHAELADAIKKSNVNSNDWKREVKERLQDRKTQQRRVFDDRPIIEDRAELHEVVDESCEALQKVGGLYERYGDLVELVDMEKEGGTLIPEIQPVKASKLRDILSRAARFERWTPDGSKAIKPPKDIVESLHARREWGLPRLRGFVEGAAMLSDGDVICTEGYHPGAGLYVRNAVQISGLRKPSQEDAAKAYQLLTGLICDFELDTPRGPHEAAWVSTVLTMLARPAIDGCTPLFLFDANRPRIGKTRLADLAHVVVTGREAYKESYPGGRDADSELQKIITSTALSGTPVAFFDNVKGRLGGPAFELALTTGRWSGRILGESRKVEADLSLTWIATSNNATLTPDMHGRCLLIRLSTDLEHPERREGFKYPHLMRHALEHREEYLSAALTILRAWHVAGRPEFGFRPWGSYEAWGQVVRNAVMFAGGTDPCESRSGLVDADDETRALRAVLATWPEGTAFTSSELSRGIKVGELRDERGMPCKNFVDALQEYIIKTHPVSITSRLRIGRGRVHDGRRIVGTEDPALNQLIWTVEKL